MGLRDAPTNRQPQADPSYALGSLVPNPIESLKHPLQIIRRNTYPLITDLNDELPLVLIPPDSDAPSFRRVLDSVAQEITQHLFKTFGVNDRHQRIGGEVVDQAMLCRLDTDAPYHLSGKPAHVCGAFVQAQSPIVYLREVQ